MAKPIVRHSAIPEGRHAVTYPAASDARPPTVFAGEGQISKTDEEVVLNDVDTCQAQQQRVLQEAESAAVERGLKLGQEQGLEQGLELARQQTQEQLGRITELVDHFSSALDEITQALSDDLPVLVLETINLLLGDLDLGEQLIAHAVQEVLNGSAQRSFDVRVAADDFAIAQQHIAPVLEQQFPKADIRFSEDQRIKEGGCIIQSTNMTVDARLESQLDRLKQALRLIKPKDQGDSHLDQG